jgi:hypothetical protein
MLIIFYYYYYHYYGHKGCDCVFWCGACGTLCLRTEQFAAAWAVTNIASGDSRQTKCVTARGGIASFVNMCSDDSVRIRDQVIRYDLS